MQKFLEDRSALAQMFPLGKYVTRRDGSVIADFMVALGRIGTSYTLPQAADHFRNASALANVGAGLVIGNEQCTPHAIDAAALCLLTTRLCRRRTLLGG
jgi:hypothetical protein